MNLKITLGICAAALVFPASQVLAKAAATDVIRLGQDLTPVGAEKAGNKEGTIPAWTGGEKQRGALKGEFPNDPAVDGDKVLFTITQSNVAQYADKLTAGHKELLKRFADYKMNVYPTRRVAAFPDDIYKSTMANASNCELAGTDDLNNCKLGFPFPIPKSGAEIIWNHKLKWRAENVRRYNNQMIVQPSGDSQLTKIIEDVKFIYSSIKHPGEFKDGHGEYLLYLARTVAPPRLAGTFILVHDRSGTGNEGRVAWIYNPGIHRVRRAPAVQYDNPADGTDGNQFYDQVDMFNGALDLYDWKIVGKKEMYLPDNSNKIAGNTITYKDLVRPHHLNQDLPRYELHRYWVVDATLKPGKSHTLKRRVFYVDEDTWNIVAVDGYDNRDQLYKFQEGHEIFGANVLASTTVPELIYDFQSGRYFITAAFNEDQPYDLTQNFSDDYFTPASVQKMTSK